jgi:hypothetical protein
LKFILTTQLPANFGWKYTILSLNGIKLCWETCEAHKGISMGVFSHAVDITMRPNVQRSIERNVKCHVTFFRLIKFKIFLWVCNNMIFIVVHITLLITWKYWLFTVKLLVLLTSKRTRFHWICKLIASIYKRFTSDKWTVSSTSAVLYDSKPITLAALPFLQNINNYN